jgi:hemerythrin-like domain-containing protein
LTHIKAAVRAHLNTAAMPGIANSLAEHHRQFDRLLAAAQAAAGQNDWRAYRERLAALRASLESHIVFEERDLFPAFERASPQAGGVTATMREEHATLRTLLARLAAAAPAIDPEGCRAELDSLRSALRRHAAQEEGMLYRASEHLSLPEPRADETLPELDVRGLEPPAPMMRIMQALAGAPRQPLRVRIHREPIPLYELLAERGFTWRTTPLDDGSYEVLIERSGS